MRQAVHAHQLGYAQPYQSLILHHEARKEQQAHSARKGLVRKHMTTKDLMEKLCSGKVPISGNAADPASRSTPTTPRTEPSPPPTSTAPSSARPPTHADDGAFEGPPLPHAVGITRDLRRLRPADFVETPRTTMSLSLEIDAAVARRVRGLSLFREEDKAFLIPYTPFASMPAGHKYKNLLTYDQATAKVERHGCAGLTVNCFDPGLREKVAQGVERQLVLHPMTKSYEVAASRDANGNPLHGYQEPPAGGRGGGGGGYSTLQTMAKILREAPPTPTKAAGKGAGKGSNGEAAGQPTSSSHGGAGTSAATSGAGGAIAMDEVQPHEAERQLYTVIRDDNGIELEFAPLAARPEWLPDSGPGQRMFECELWTVSIHQLMAFLTHCVRTTTWDAIAEVKGERNITMHDIRDHFILPWTQGTGCSIAMLLHAAAVGWANRFLSDIEPAPPPKVEGYVVHAWRGSVVELRQGLRDLVKRQHVHANTRVFIDALCLYVPDDVYDVDGASEGLLQAEQMGVSTRLLQLEKRLTRRNLGLEVYVMHSARCSVFSRAWALHELCVSLAQGLRVWHSFDFTLWEELGSETSEGGEVEFKVRAASHPKAAQSECSRWQDRVMLWTAFKRMVEPPPPGLASAKMRAGAPKSEPPKDGNAVTAAAEGLEDKDGIEAAADGSDGGVAQTRGGAPTRTAGEGLRGFAAVDKVARLSRAAAQRTLRRGLHEYSELDADGDGRITRTEWEVYRRADESKES